MLELLHRHWVRGALLFHFIRLFKFFFLKKIHFSRPLRTISFFLFFIFIHLCIITNALPQSLEQKILKILKYFCWPKWPVSNHSYRLFVTFYRDVMVYFSLSQCLAHVPLLKELHPWCKTIFSTWSTFNPKIQNIRICEEAHKKRTQLKMQSAVILRLIRFIIINAVWLVHRAMMKWVMFW